MNKRTNKQTNKQTNLLQPLALKRRRNPKMLLRNRFFNPQTSSLFTSSSISRITPSFLVSFTLSFNKPFIQSIQQTPNRHLSTNHASSASKTENPSSSSSSSSSNSDTSKFIKTAFFLPPGVEPDLVTEDMILPGSNIVIGPYAGHSQIKQVEFVKSSAKPKDCPKDEKPEFAMLGRSNVGKSSLINSLCRKKEVALTSKKPGKTQLINHFLVNKSWYIVDLPGYGFANAPQSARTDWSSFTKGFLNSKTLVAVLLLIDGSIPPQKIDLDCANWLGRNNIPMTFVFTKCDKTKAGKGNRPDENIKIFQEIIRNSYKAPPPWIMTSSVTGLGRDELLLHMSQLRNYWDN